MGPGPRAPNAGSAPHPGDHTTPAARAATLAATLVRDTRDQRKREATPFSPEAWIGRVIDDRYRIDELLGEGGMGAVFVAEHLRLRKQVAVKIIRPEIANDGQHTARFRREAMATARIDHPHVASAMDYGELPEGGYYLVIQLVRGQNLRDYLNIHTRLEWQEACDIGSQIADALAAAHAEGIVHRDLKPDNILLERRDNGDVIVKVLDFGIARIVAPDQEKPRRGGTEQQALTRVGMVVGTPGYMAPEQAMGESVDERADLYALGVVVWESIAGRPLWKAPTLGELFAQQFQQDPPTLRSALGKPVHEALEALVAELLDRDPNGRVRDAVAVRNVFKRLALGLDPDAKHSGLFDPDNLQGAEPKAPAVLSPPTAAHEAWHVRLATSARYFREDLEQRMGKRNVRLLLIILLLLPLVAVALVLALRGGDEPREEPPPIAEQAPAKAPPVDPPPKDTGDAEDDTALEETTDDTPEDETTGGAALSPELTAALEVLLHDEDRAARRKAASALLEHEAELPDYVRLTARFEDMDSCEGKRDVIFELKGLGDPRALPNLELLAAVRKRGCGKRKRSDCWGCLRKPLGETIKALSAASPPPE
ncbi:MAG: serine/threonine-protein kinase [Nannocystaceae bacterium]